MNKEYSDIDWTKVKKGTRIRCIRGFSASVSKGEEYTFERLMTHLDVRSSNDFNFNEWIMIRLNTGQVWGGFQGNRFEIIDSTYEWFDQIFGVE